MRRVQRLALDADTQNYLAQRQADADAKFQADALKPGAHWDASRQTKAIGPVLATLQQMMGQHQRCMYCVDSHGCDIEHFHPKAAFPHWMYRWANLLLCCTECGRLKGDRFPMQGDQALLIDPTSEEPWHFLDFDPDTGNLTACFELASNAESIKGQATTTLLQLDQREALAAGYQRTWRRLQKSLRHFLEAPSSADTLIANLLEADDHGLIGWCFKGNGQHEPLLTTLRQQHPAIWNACLQKFTFY